MNEHLLRKIASVTIIIMVLLTSSAVSLALPATVSSAEVTGNFTLQKPPPKGNPKLDSTLSQLASQNGTTAIGPLTFGFAPQTTAGTVRVIIEAAAGQTNNITSSAASLGNIEGKYGNLVQMVVPTSKLSALAQLPSAKFVRLPNKPLPLVTSEGVPLINADDWQAASYNGTGVKIGILDVGFSGYTMRQAEGELAANITTWWAPSIGNAGANIHGTACAEIVYDIAPAATYYLANFATDVEYGNAVNWLISQNVTIISCSVGWPTGGPGNGTGFFCQVIDSAKAAGIFWAQAIGNHAQRHWQGTWSNPDGDYWHNFSGTDELNDITVSNGQLIVAVLKWNDPWYASSNDYELLLYDSSYHLVAYSMNTQNGDDEPWEALGYYATYTGTYYISIATLVSPAPVTFHLYSYYQDLQYQTPASSFTVPADSFSTVAVGAVNYATPTALEPFSSRGPTDDGRIIPALVAPDGVSTRTYGTSTFNGTSAAAPHTAGAAALVKQRFPTYTPAQIQAFMEGRAVDLGTAGKDNLYGSGRLDLGTASNNFTLTMVVNGSGTVTPAAGSYSYIAGSTVNITATAASGWQFVKWTGEVSNNATATTNVTVDKDKVVTAYFTLIPSAGSNDPPIHIPVCTVSGDQRRPQIINDGLGGAIITWQDKRNGNDDIYAQRLDNLGNPIWTAGGLAICTDSSTQDYPQIILSTNNTAIITWQDLRNGYKMIFAQQLDLFGNILWTVNGVAISNIHNQYTFHRTVANNAGGAIIGWVDGRNGNSDIYAQHIDSSGNVLWIADGIPICIANGEQQFTQTEIDPIAQLISDGTGGAIFTWQDQRSGIWNIYAQRVDISGNILWTTNGVPVYTTSVSKRPVLVSDNNGGAIVTWGESGIIAQKLDSSGNLKWAPGGIGICGSGIYGPVTIPTSGGAIIAWQDNRALMLPDIYAQRVDASGNVLWTPNGIAICTNHADCERPSLIPDNANGALIVWRDKRNDYYGLFAQRIHSSGNVMWASNGIAVNTAINSQGDKNGVSGEHVVSNGENEKAIITWIDKLIDNWDLYVALLYQNAGIVINYSLTLKVSGGGTISPSIGGYSYTANTTVTLTATPSSGWAFAGWTGDVSNNTSATTNVTMDSNQTVIANFTRVTSILKMTLSGNGNVTPARGLYSYPIGTSVNITASPAINWAFLNWTGDVTDNASSSTNVTMNWDKTIIANFVRVNSTLTMAVSGSGIVTPAAGNYTYPVGTSVNITATPASGWRFVNWTGNVGTVANVNSASTNVTMNSDYTITASFTQIPVSSGGGGGGGGGGVTNDKRITSLIGVISTDTGRIGSAVQAESLDSKLTLDIPVGTIAKNRNGFGLSSVTVTTITERNQPPAGHEIVGGVYDLGPKGATFNPPITLTLQYSKSDVPAGARESNLYLATWDESVQAWSRIDCQVDRTTNKITAAISHFSQYAILASTQAAAFTLSDIVASPARILTGESITISIKVANTGNLTGDYQAILKINDAVQETKSITLEANASAIVSFKTVGGKTGTYSVDIGGVRTSFTVLGKPASFKVESLSISPAEIEIGEMASISINVTNTGESEGKYLLTLKINTKEVDTREISLAGETSQRVTFKATSDTPGKKIVEINGLIGGFIVKGEVPPPSQIPLPLEKPENTIKLETGSIPQITPPTTSQEPAKTTESKAWVFGVIAGGVLLVAMGAFFFTQRRKRG